jgi:hypothetical protein
MENAMDEQEELRQARLLADIVDGRAGMDAAADYSEALSAAVAANLLQQGFGDAPELSGAFDAQLRQRLVDRTAARAKVIPIHRKPWARAALAAALIVLIIGPLWFFSRAPGNSPFGDESVRQLKRIEYYDKKYESRLDQLRGRLDNGVESDMAMRTTLSRSDQRFEVIRKKRQNERRLTRDREYMSGGNEI